MRLDVLPQALTERAELASKIAVEMLSVIEKHGADSDLCFSVMQIVQDTINYRRNFEERKRYQSLGTLGSPMPRMY